jgi:histidinol-phosphate aminotransferase
MSNTPKDLIRDEIRALAAYHVQDATGMVKLDAMENPYPLPPALAAEVAALAASAPVNRYPDPRSPALKARLREAMQIPPGMELVLGNGSDELIQMLALAVAKPGATILGVEPSFVMFRMIATFCGLRYVGVPLKPDFSLDTEAVLAALAREKPALTFIAYPNNPTGNLFDETALTRIVGAAPGLVVVDEAYTAFASRSFLPRLAEFPHLLVMRTLSKLGLAGLRLGLLAGRAEWLDELDKVRLPYNVNVLTQLVAEKVLAHAGALAAQAKTIVAERARLAASLAETRGVTAFASDANFILFRVPRAKQVFDGLKARRVLVKNLDGSHPLLADCLRVTVGTPQENDAFIGALRQAI